MNIRNCMAMGCAALALSACWDSDDDAPVAVAPGVTEAVPAAASTSPAAALQYLGELTAVASARADMLEPVNPVPDSLATDDTAEPKLIE